MMISQKLSNIWSKKDNPVLIKDNEEIYYIDLISNKKIFLDEIKQGDVVLLIGDFDPDSINILFQLIEKKAIIAPLTQDTKKNHKYFADAISAKFIIENKKVVKCSERSNKHDLIEIIRDKQSPGFIFFSSGTTGKPKAILHDVDNLLKKYEKPRRTLIAINFLMFDHLGGINTFFHMLFNGGTIISLSNRGVKYVINLCEKHQVELLPTTPTFLRMLLMSGMIPDSIPKSIKIITYGTERMDETTLKELTRLLPDVDFRQTYGLSEFNAFRIKSKSRDSLYFKFGDDLDFKIKKDILYIKSTQQMMGYLGDENPFDQEGWFKTNDIVDQKDGYIKIIGRNTDLINVGGLKFMGSDVENTVMKYQDVVNVKAYAKSNPLTGQHSEIILEVKDETRFPKKDFRVFLKNNLPKHMVPQKIVYKKVEINTRFKKK